MTDTRPEYPPEYDDVTECVTCEGEFNSTIKSPDHPQEPLENYCCSWECYAIKLKCDIAKLRRGRGIVPRYASGRSSFKAPALGEQ